MVGRNKQLIIIFMLVGQRNISYRLKSQLETLPSCNQLNGSSGNDPTGRSSHTSVTPPKMDYRGFTLKEYFELMEQEQRPGIVIEEDEQDNCSSKGAKTPSFNQEPSAFRQHRRTKIKTEIQEDEIENFHKNNHIRNIPNLDKSFGVKFSVNTNGKKSPGLTGSHPYNRPQHKKTHLDPVCKNHKLSTIPSNSGIISLNRSTLTGFYQLDLKKKKFLSKIKADKNRGNNLRLSDAFFITKYGSKFDISAKKIT